MNWPGIVCKLIDRKVPGTTGEATRRRMPSAEMSWTWAVHGLPLRVSEMGWHEQTSRQR
jgi:hypothetical protein